MALELIAVDGCTIDHSSGSGVSGGSFVIVPLPSVKCKAEGKGIYRGVTIAFTFSGGNFTGCTDGTVVGAGVITATAVNTKVDGLVVIREGDAGTMTGVGTNTAPPPPTLPAVGPVEITVAGQTKVKAQ